MGQQIVLHAGFRPAAHEIIGVVQTTVGGDLRDAPRPSVYTPAGDDLRIATFHVRSRLPTDQAAALVRATIQELEPNLPVDSIATVQDELVERTAEERVLAKLGLVVAALALLMAAGGVFASVAVRVTERTREFGIRMALGASRGRVGASVVHRGVGMTAGGIVAGLALYGALSPLLHARLYEVSPLDPAVLVATTAILLCSGALAAWLPARRATTVDPTVALRAD